MSGLALVARRARRDGHGLGPRRTRRTSQPLREAGIAPVIGHAPENVPAGDDVEVVVSTAIAAGQPRARRRGRARPARAAPRRAAGGGQRAEAHAGGRRDARQDDDELAWPPTCCCGWGRSPATSSAASCARRGATRPGGAGEWLVVEADESDRSFLRLSPQLSVVTNVELDHHATYGSLAEVEAAFGEFLARSGRCILWDGPDVDAFLDRVGHRRGGVLPCRRRGAAPGRLRVHVGGAARAPARARRAQRAERRGGADGVRDDGPAAGGARGDARGLPRRRAALRGAGDDGRRRDGRRRLRPSPDRGRGDARRRADAAARRASSRSSSRTCTRARSSSRGSSARRSRPPTSSASSTSTRRARPRRTSRA